MGKAKIKNNYFEVSSLGEFIDNGEEIEIINIENNKIYVKQIKID
jgi:membrane-bound ClpP family serine protease